MLRHSHLAAASAALVVIASAVAGQTPTPAPVQVHGVVYDSLRGIALAGALVSVAGNSRLAKADSRGRFVLDSVLPGERTFAAQHAALDSVGFSGISTRVTVTDGRSTVLIAAPSFPTLWRTVCGTSRPPKDSGFVYGTVRDAATQTTTPNAIVQVTWIDVRVDKAKRITENRWTGESDTDATGSYNICGVPLDVGLRIRATTDSGGSGSINLFSNGLRVQRRDLTIGPAMFDSLSASQRGTIAGLVTDTAGTPIADARVIADGAPELRSGADGRFIVRDVPIGSRQVEVLAIGKSPVLTVADVTASDTAVVVASMHRITTLDVIRVTASPATRRLVRDIEERRKLGAGYFRDSTDLVGHGSLFSVFHAFPSMRVERTGRGTDFMITLASAGRRCLANVVVDGRRSDFDELNFLRPADIAALEVYPRRMSLPMRFLRNDDCGAIVVWTKWNFG